MINKLLLILLFISVAILPQSLFAQFINLQITIEPKLSVEVERVLNFGEVISNSGIKEISISDVNAGIFSIRAIQSQLLYLELNFPDALILENSQTDKIPLELRASYNNSGTNNISNAQILLNNSDAIVVGGSSNNTSNYWHKLYVYVYGSIDVGNIPNGVYKGEVIIFINYE